MKKIIYVLVLIPFMAFSQNSGIEFDRSLNWADVCAKAKSEGKYIFVDCFTTWCGPCKLMENNIYSLSSVREFMQPKYLSIKLQMDTSARDNDYVKGWYKDAHRFMEMYRVDKFPTFLFFSPEGKLVHEDFGYKNQKEFIDLASVALDPTKQYFTLLDSYRHGVRRYDQISYLAIASQKIGNKSLSDSLAYDYVHNYLEKEGRDSLYTRRNINFMVYDIQSSNEPSFSVFYNNSKKIDSIMEDRGLSQRVVDYIIYKEEIASLLWKEALPLATSPRWDSLESVIKRKYDKRYAERNILNGEISWNQDKKDWEKVVQYNVEKVEKYGVDTSALGRLYLNNMIFEVIFKYSKDERVLNKALGWMKMILHSDTNDIYKLDTYANLLYKIGRKDVAISTEEKVVKLAPSFEKEEFQRTLEKMRRGERTWNNL